jgi:hypothetical protein
MPPGKNQFAVIIILMIIIIIIIIRVCKWWTKNYPALALRHPRSILLPLVVHPSVNPTLLVKGRTFLIVTSW